MSISSTLNMLLSLLWLNSHECSRKYSIIIITSHGVDGRRPEGLYIRKIHGNTFIYTFNTNLLKGWTFSLHIAFSVCPCLRLGGAPATLVGDMLNWRRHPPSRLTSEDLGADPPPLLPGRPEDYVSSCGILLIARRRRLSHGRRTGLALETCDKIQ